MRTTGHHRPERRLAHAAPAGHVEVVVGGAADASICGSMYFMTSLAAFCGQRGRKSIGNALATISFALERRGVMSLKIICTRPAPIALRAQRRWIAWRSCNSLASDFITSAAAQRGRRAVEVGGWRASLAHLKNTGPSCWSAWGHYIVRPAGGGHLNLLRNRTA